MQQQNKQQILLLDQQKETYSPKELSQSSHSKTMRIPSLKQNQNMMVIQHFKGQGQPKEKSQTLQNEQDNTEEANQKQIDKLMNDQELQQHKDNFENFTLNQELHTFSRNTEQDRLNTDNSRSNFLTLNDNSNIDQINLNTFTGCHSTPLKNPTISDIENASPFEDIDKSGVELTGLNAFVNGRNLQEVGGTGQISNFNDVQNSADTSRSLNNYTPNNEKNQQQEFHTMDSQAWQVSLQKMREEVLIKQEQDLIKQIEELAYHRQMVQRELQRVQIEQQNQQKISTLSQSTMSQVITPIKNEGSIHSSQYQQTSLQKQNQDQIRAYPNYQSTRLGAASKGIGLTNQSQFNKSISVQNSPPSNKYEETKRNLKVERSPSNDYSQERTTLYSLRMGKIRSLMQEAGESPNESKLVNPLETPNFLNYQQNMQMSSSYNSNSNRQSISISNYNSNVKQINKEGNLKYQNNAPSKALIDTFNQEATQESQKQLQTSSSEINAEELRRNIQDVARSLARVKAAEERLFQELERKKQTQSSKLDTAYHNYAINQIQHKNNMLRNVSPKYPSYGQVGTELHEIQETQFSFSRQSQDREEEANNNKSMQSRANDKQKQPSYRQSVQYQEYNQPMQQNVKTDLTSSKSTRDIKKHLKNLPRQKQGTMFGMGIYQHSDNLINLVIQTPQIDEYSNEEDLISREESKVKKSEKISERNDSTETIKMDQSQVVTKSESIIKTQNIKQQTLKNQNSQYPYQQDSQSAQQSAASNMGKDDKKKILMNSSSQGSLVTVQSYKTTQSHQVQPTKKLISKNQAQNIQQQQSTTNNLNSSRLPRNTQPGRFVFGKNDLSPNRKKILKQAQKMNDKNKMTNGQNPKQMKKEQTQKQEEKKSNQKEEQSLKSSVYSMSQSSLANFKTKSEKTQKIREKSNKKYPQQILKETSHSRLSQQNPQQYQSQNNPVYLRDKLSPSRINNQPQWVSSFTNSSSLANNNSINSTGLRSERSPVFNQNNNSQLKNTPSSLNNSQHQNSMINSSNNQGHRNYQKNQPSSRFQTSQVQNKFQRRDGSAGGRDKSIGSNYERNGEQLKNSRSQNNLETINTNGSAQGKEDPSINFSKRNQIFDSRRPTEVRSPFDARIVQFDSGSQNNDQTSSIQDYTQGSWIGQYQDRVQKFIATSPSKNLQQRLATSQTRRYEVPDEQSEYRGAIITIQSQSSGMMPKVIGFDANDFESAFSTIQNHPLQFNSSSQQSSAQDYNNSCQTEQNIRSNTTTLQNDNLTRNGHANIFSFNKQLSDNQYQQFNTDQQIINVSSKNSSIIQSSVKSQQIPQQQYQQQIYLQNLAQREVTNGSSAGLQYSQTQSNEKSYSKYDKYQSTVAANDTQNLHQQRLPTEFEEDGI